MNQILTELIQAVAVAAIPILAAFVIRLLNAGAREAKENAKSEAVGRIMDEVTDAVSTAVAYVSQRQVNALKKNGKFDEKAASDALTAAINHTRYNLSEEARRFLEENYINLTNYLDTRIEAEVKRQNEIGG